MKNERRTFPAVVRFDSRRLHILSEAGDLDEWRTIGEKDKARFDGWIDGYRHALHKSNAAETLLNIGREMFRWLDGDEGWIGRLLESATPPFFIEFSVPARPDPDGLAFLEVPWELMADETGHLAADPYIIYCPVRRIGKRGEPGEPSEFRLSTVFMAAAPRGGDSPLRYEEEESAILDAAGSIGMDLTVEESGAPVLLADCLAREHPVDVLHISCHGTNSPGPLLMLETEEGDKAPAGPGALSRSLGGATPRLLFISACMTSEPDAFLNSFSSEMIRRGAPSVLGWGGSVGDVEATRFASGLYQRLARSDALEEAVARSRLLLLRPDREGGAAPVSRDWHLARLYLGPRGGGTFARGEMARRPGRAVSGHKEFLDAKNKRIPVAGYREFVGRRRAIQTILREFRAFEHAGVLIHGFGRQGKSSLAARIANRMPSRQVVVVFVYYDARSILDALVRFSGSLEVKELVEKKYVDLVRNDPGNLEVALRELLEGPFGRLEKNESGDVVRRPILLVMDDFEQALDKPAEKGGRHRVKSGLAPAIRSVIDAFSRAATDSRLLFTSRYTFTLPYKGSDLVGDLLPLHLPPMVEHEGKKQAAAKERYYPGKKKKTSDPRRTERCIKMARGNPGLQDLLFSMSLEAPSRCDKALEEMEAYIESGEAAGEETLREFLENLAVDGLLDLLTPTEKDLLRSSTLFRIPVPLETLGLMGLGAGERLFALGLWDAYEDLVDPVVAAAAVNPMAGPKSGLLTDKEQRALAEMLLNDLFERWGGESRPDTADVELTRLGLLAENGNVVLAAAENALIYLGKKFEYRAAAAMAIATVQLLEKKRLSRPPTLYRVAAERNQRVGRVDVAEKFIASAVDDYEAYISAGKSVDQNDYSHAITIKARMFVQRGKPDEAERLLQKAASIDKKQGRQINYAVTLGDIARIRVSKGEVDE
ncbi:MAG: CHAT domain-containing protein, partial [Desulfobacterales bacterium]|nr:CHAT domain-containing protein [Desulfobacterales bacterium]